MTTKCLFYNEGGVWQMHHDGQPWFDHSAPLKYIEQINNLTLKLVLVDFGFPSVRFVFEDDNGSRYFMFHTEFQKLIDDGVDLRNFTANYKFIIRGGYYGIKVLNYV